MNVGTVSTDSSKHALHMQKQPHLSMQHIWWQFAGALRRLCLLCTSLQWFVTGVQLHCRESLFRHSLIVKCCLWRWFIRAGLIKIQLNSNCPLITIPQSTLSLMRE